VTPSLTDFFQLVLFSKNKIGLKRLDFKGRPLAFEGCLFSVTGQVVTAKRASLDSHTVALFMFLHEALPVVQKMMVRKIIKNEWCVNEKDECFMSSILHMCGNNIYI